MIDIHNHILFGVDDGCKTIEDSIQMIEKAISVGVTEMILTPHYAPLRGYVVSNKIIDANFSTLKQEVEKLQLPIKLHLGREIDEVDDIDILLSSGKVKTMNKTKYVLLDFGMKKADIDEYCYELIINGYIPIIAHPERYNYVASHNEYHRWKKTGALIQINSTSINKTKNKSTKKNVMYLLKNNLVDFVASDCHRLPDNYDSFKDAQNLIFKKYKDIKLKSKILI